MTLTFLHIRSYERQLYIDEAAARRDLSAVLLETRLLGLLLVGVVFDANVSTGGTSLSKVGVINVSISRWLRPLGCRV